MTTSEAIDVFKKYLTTKIVPYPMELIESSKIAIKVLTQQLEETDKQHHWKPSEEQIEALRLSFEEAFDDAGDCNRYRRLKSLYEQLKKLM